jgi:hypothetical protein
MLTVAVDALNDGYRRVTGNL